MRFEEAYAGWQEKRLTQEDAGQLLGVSGRTFRRQIGRFEADGMQGLIDLRMSQVSSRRAPVDEVLGVQRLYSAQYSGWNVKHFHTWYAREHQGTRSYSWVKNVLQEAKLVVRSKARGKHRKKRERKPLAGMMVHQDASTHQVGARADLGSGGDPRRCHQRAHQHVLLHRGRHRLEFSRYRADAGAPRNVLQPVHRPGQSLLSHPGGGWQSSISST